MRAPTDPRTSPNHTARAPGVRVEMFAVHWTGGTFEATLDWIGRRAYMDKRIYASYHALFGAKGEIAYPVPFARAAYSVGVSHPHDERFRWSTAGNSASENVALAGAPPRKPTAIQVDLLTEILAERLAENGYGPDDVWRIVGHDEVAWKRGRKTDPQGQDWLPLAPVREAVRAVLLADVAETLIPVPTP